MIVEMLMVGPLQTNCYVVGCEKTKQAVVIDPGDEAQRIADTARDLGLTISQVLLTHAHFDHTAAANQLMQATGASLAVHPDDQELLEVGGGATLFGLPKPQIPTEVRQLIPGQSVPVGKLELQVLHTPGHTPGHVSFYEATGGAVFDGDVLFASGIGRTDMPGGSYQVLMRSIQEQIFTLPDDTIVYPGHGPATTVGQEKVGNPWL